MLNQDVTYYNFLKLVKRGDYTTYFDYPNKKNSNLKEYKEKLLKIAEDRFTNDNCNFSAIKKIDINGQSIFVLKKTNDQQELEQRISEDFIIRKINSNLCKVYGIQQADRYKIITLIKNILSEKQSFYVLKTDIKKFYESINKKAILENLNQSSLLSFDTKYLLNTLFSIEEIQNSQGIPRGLCISASLAEYYMKKFDHQIISLDGVFYFARYVDDIIIFSINEIDIKKDLAPILPDGLSFNLNKTQCINTKKNFSFQFLGYQFSRKNINDKLRVSISPKKISKIKQRIVKAFIAYNHDHNFKLLRKRLLFLTVNYPLKTGSQEVSNIEKNENLHGGLAYNYPLLQDNNSSLKDLDKFFSSVLFSKHFSKVNQKLSKKKKLLLKKYSFENGFKKRIVRKFVLKDLKEITDCWSC